MALFPKKWDLPLPLLTKELVEQSARPRTYIIRVICALLVILIGSLRFSQEMMYAGQSAWAMVGRGGSIFESLVIMQFFGVYLLMPALTCGVITEEKERDSLMLLFLTKLGPWSILFEKLSSRLVTMVALLLLCLPLQALAYSFGGVSPLALWGSQYSLLVVAVQMGSLGLACSAFFRTTTMAFVWSYLIGIVMLMGPLVLFIIYGAIQDSLSRPPIPNELVAILRSWGVIESEVQVLFPFFAAVQFAATTSSKTSLFIGSIPSILSCFVFLTIARTCLVSRAFVAPRNLLLDAFKLVDASAEKANRMMGNMTLSAKTDESFPDDKPIQWRETEKRSIGRNRYIVRLIALAVIPIFLILGLTLLKDIEATLIAQMILTPCVWFISVLSVSVTAVGLVSGERSHQTLDVLMTMPLTGAEIIKQKFSAVWRVIWICWCPLVVLLIAGAILRSTDDGARVLGSWRHAPPVSLYLMFGLLSALIYLPMIGWLSCLVGMIFHNRGRAIIAALIIVVGWIVLPFILIILPLEISRTRILNDFPFSMLPTASPITFPVINEANELELVCGNEFRNYNYDPNSIYRGRPPIDWAFFTRACLAGFANYAWYGLCAYTFFTVCVRQADRLLGRNGSRLEERLVSSNDESFQHAEAQSP